MRGRRHRHIRRLLVSSAGFLLLLAVPATGPAQSPGVGELKKKSAALAEQSNRAVVDLYALESRLQQARDDLARVDARAAELARQQSLAHMRFRAARRTMAIAQFRLGRQLKLLYEQPDPDPLAVILGATSLDEAIEGLESLRRTARSTESVITQAHSAKVQIGRAQRELALKAGRARAAQAALAATTAGLEQARNERASYIAQIRTELDLTNSQISTLERQAQEAQQRAQAVTQQAATAAQSPSPSSTTTAPPTSTAAETPQPDTSTPDTSTPPEAPAESVTQETPEAPPPVTAPVRPGGSMTVYATGYCLKGTTATGLPVGPGIVATDPTVIPLGTRMSIPGYGEGVAADTGGAIKGARIDVWIASCAQAGAFNRSVTITFH